MAKHTDCRRSRMRLLGGLWNQRVESMKGRGGGNVSSSISGGKSLLVELGFLSPQF